MNASSGVRSSADITWIASRARRAGSSSVPAAISRVRSSGQQRYRVEQFACLFQQRVEWQLRVVRDGAADRT